MNAVKIIGFLLICLIGGLKDIKAQDFQVIGNQLGVSSLSQAELINIFKPKNNRWENNRPVVIVLPGGMSPINEQVAQQVYSKSFIAVQKYWLSLVFQGRFNAPYFFNSDEETINFIRKTPGAIGFVASSTPVPAELVIKIR